nr:autotransporter outer membrane beta-barrel domain-containing protein [Dyella sp. 2HG41-7]
MLQIANANAVTYASAITGSGSLTQSGSGILILNGANTYAGGTTVQAGTLEVGDSSHTNATVQNDVTVNAGGTLRGHGTIIGNVTSDGTVWPGGSVGVLTIVGNYTQNADATLQVDVTPTQASELNVYGNASLAGTVNIIYAPGTYANTTYTLVQAKQVTGQFAAMTSTGSVPTALNPTLSYNTSQAQLTLAAASTTPVTPPATTVVAPQDGSLYANLMRSQDLVGQQVLSTVLDATLRNGDMGCNGSAGASHTNTVASACHSDLWMQYSGGSDSLTGSNGLNSTSFGLQGGFDHGVTDTAHVGIEAGYNRINGSDRNGGNGTIDSVHGGVYAYANVGPTVLSGMLDGTHSSYSIYRQTGIGHGVTRPDGDAMSAAVQAAWPMTMAQWQVTPAVGALYEHQTLNAFGETVPSNNPLADEFSLQGAHTTYNVLQPYARVQFSHAFTAQGISYLPQFDVGYRYDTRSNNMPVVQATSQDGTVFMLPGDRVGRGVATVGARINAQAGASWSLYLDYQGQFSSHLNDNALSVGFTKTF